jgi:fluoroacetyl-CoA thioesterase
MRTGLARGVERILEIEVTPQMTVEFDGRPLHPFYPTYWACHHAEYCCRLLLEPFLEPDEEGIGSGLFIHHHAPALVGQTVKIRARATRVRARHLACQFEMTERGRRVAHGYVHQVILRKARVAELSEALRRESEPFMPSNPAG